MDQFVTTYRRDYLWPLSRPPPLVAGPTYGTRCVPVQCRCAPRPHTDPKLYPARVGAPPEVESSRYDQPNAFLLKLYEKYPFLYNTLRSAPKDDIANRLYKDRMRTTYQIDYCKMNEFPNTEYENLLRAAGVSGTIQDAWTNTLPGCPCRPVMRDNIASRRGIISKMTSPKGISVSKMAALSSKRISPIETPSMDSFITTYDNDYQWRPSVPFLNIPKRPPKDTQPRKGIYMRRPVEGACTCDDHGWEPQRDRYRCLADKERRLCSDLVALRKQMTDLCNSIMDHPCGDAETKLESLYSSDYKVKGFPNTTFRKLMAAADSPVGVPIVPLDIGLNYAYRDPTSFRYLPIVRPNVNPSRPITFGVTPHSCNEWFQPLPVRTEYQDTISKVGRAIVKSRQQYREPMPSTRRRPDDPCL